MTTERKENLPVVKSYALVCIFAKCYNPDRTNFIPLYLPPSSNIRILHSLISAIDIAASPSLVKPPFEHMGPRPPKTTPELFSGRVEPRFRRSPPKRTRIWSQPYRRTNPTSAAITDAPWRRSFIAGTLRGTVGSRKVDWITVPRRGSTGQRTPRQEEERFSVLAQAGIGGLNVLYLVFYTEISDKIALKCGWNAERLRMMC